MNEKISRLIPAAAVAMVLGSMIFSHSCANTTTAPSGGAKDTIPPYIVNISPLPGSVNVPVHGAKITFTFDEYVKVKDPKGIYLSPPQAKAPRYKMRGKSVVVYFEDDLDSNTTYTLDLTGAITDNNEDNPFPGYTLTFSTGTKMDSMVVTGSVLDCQTLQPVKGATVMLYRDLSDTAVFSHRPDMAIKTDEWGYFAIRNVADAEFRLYAIMDEISNNIYDADADKIAFIDSIIRPVMVVSDTLPELLKYDMKDTLHCMARKSEYELMLFRDQSSDQKIKEKALIDDRTYYVSFMAPNASIDSLWIRNIPQKKLIMEFNRQKDSLLVWINEPNIKRLPDTLHMFVDYLRTNDSLKVLEPHTEHLKISRAERKAKMRKNRGKVNKNDTLCVYTVKAEPETVEQYGFSMEFSNPIINEGFGELSLKSINPRQQEKKMEYTVTRDSTNLRRYMIMPKGKLQTGFEYVLKVPHKKFRDITGFWNDSTEVKVSLPKDDKLSTLTLVCNNVRHKYLVDLLNEKRDKVIRNYAIDSDKPLVFPYMKAGKYSIRITEDYNGNGKVDTGNLEEKRQPERVKFYKLKGGSYVIDVLEATDLEQTIDFAKLFEN